MSQVDRRPGRGRTGGLETQESMERNVLPLGGRLGYPIFQAWKRRGSSCCVLPGPRGLTEDLARGGQGAKGSVYVSPQDRRPGRGRTGC